MKFKLFLLAILIGLGGCDQGKVVEVKEKKYLLVGINPPKHFAINLRDIETGRITGELSVSKRCSAWRKARIHEVLAFKEITREYEDSRRTIAVYVKDFCDTLKERR